MNIQSSSKLKKLEQIFGALNPEDKKTLLDFAEFLQLRSGQTDEVPQEKQDIPRPAQETVVAAIKRINRTYPMINPDKVFHETSSLMTEHVLHGREASEVIDDLQALFEQHYQEYLKDSDKA
jgi:hypothetical protein